jgi:DNA-binding NtrC family response regulator
MSRSARAGAPDREVLVVEDDPSIRRLCAGILSKAGFQVSTASDGHEALSILNVTRIDIVVTDLAMPNLEGIELIGILRKRDPSLPIVVISGAFGGQFLHIALKMGARAALPKPFTASQLTESVLDALSPP